MGLLCKLYFASIDDHERCICLFKMPIISNTKHQDEKHEYICEKKQNAMHAMLQADLMQMPVRKEKRETVESK